MNINNYISYKGHLTFDELKFNEVDSLILSELSYMNLDLVAPSVHHPRAKKVKIKDLDLNIFKNTSLSSKLFNLSVEELKSIDFDEVNYLFETIRTKSVLSKQTSKITINSYKSVLIAYLVFGLNDTLEFVSEGNSSIKLDDVKTLENEIIDERLLLFRENNSSIFQNMGKKILYQLNELEPNMEVQDFSCKLKRNTYIDNVIYLMLENNYDSYNEIVNKLYSFYKYHTYDLFAAKKEIYDYCNKFIDLYIDNKRVEFTNDFEDVILNNFKPKENIIYNERKRIGKEYLGKLKFRLFVRALSDPNKELYTTYFKDDYRLDNIKKKYIDYLGEDVDFDSILEHVLMPICNDRFDKVNCLNKLYPYCPLCGARKTRYSQEIVRIDRYMWE